MERCDVLIVGGGPGGSSCARGLRGSGLDVVVLDRERFPRDKVCAGWVTPQIWQTLAIDPADYRKDRIMQPIRGFAVERVGHARVAVDCGEVVSYGIRRLEFDHFLLARCGARLRLGEPLRELKRERGRWLVNGEIEARWLVGAGGHFCPVARQLGARPGAGEPGTVVAREIEFEMTPAQRASCPTHPELPELSFAADLRGYGWMVRKGDWLNVGIGRQDPKTFPRWVEEFLDWVVEHGRVPADLPRGLRGHAYLLYDEAPRPLSGEGLLVVGDAAGLAYRRSGEGIRPAVESGLLAAQALRKVGASGVERAYARSIVARFGHRHARGHRGFTDWLPRRWGEGLAGRALAMPWFARHVVVDRWFLHRRVPPLAAG